MKLPFGLNETAVHALPAGSAGWPRGGVDVAGGQRPTARCCRRRPTATKPPSGLIAMLRALALTFARVEVSLSVAASHR